MITPIFLKELVVIFALSIAVLLACSRVKIPILLGFILTGILAGPSGIGLISEIENVDLLAHIGIVLLLFTIGMEFSLKRLLSMKKIFFIGGGLQVGLTIIFSYGIVKLLGRSTSEAILFGCMIALSSTAIIIKLLSDRFEENTPHGHVILSMLIFQDIITVPMMLIIPVLGNAENPDHFTYLHLLIKAFAILLVTFIIAVKVMPSLLLYITKMHSREVFILSLLTICFSVTLVTTEMELPASLGAFLAGLMVSESEYRHQAIGDIGPLQDLFISFFFISIGMLVDVQFLYQHLWWILSCTAAVLFIKVLCTGISTMALGMPLRLTILTALALAQVGEFSFVLAKAAMPYTLTTPFFYQLFLATALLTMALSPIFMQIAPFFAAMLDRLPLPKLVKLGFGYRACNHENTLNEHVVIIGYGLSGQHLSQACKAHSIDYTILEMNPEIVKTQKSLGESIHFGDATQPEVLRHAGIQKAQAASVLINDFRATQQIIKNIRKQNQNIYLIVRTKYLRDTNLLKDLGADEVITDEMEASTEIFTRVLEKYRVSPNLLEEFIQKLSQKPLPNSPIQQLD